MRPPKPDFNGVSLDPAAVGTASAGRLAGPSTGADELTVRLRAEVGSRLSGYAAELEGAGLPPMSGAQRREVADRLLTEAWRKETSRRLSAGLPVWQGPKQMVAALTWRFHAADS